MITLGENHYLQLSNLGLFDTDAEWIHPSITVASYELIYVLSGEVKLYEADRRFCVREGELLLLYPGLEHGGYEKRTGHTSFYWLHFYTDDLALWEITKCAPAPHCTEKVLRRLMHLQEKEPLLAELTLAQFFLEARAEKTYQNKTAHEVEEYLRIHAKKDLRVHEVAQRFGYSADHLSRLYRREFGIDLKAGIIRQRLSYMESLLLNTDATVKEIAAMSGFDDENLFVKFFKYHERITPGQYRNRFFRIHMNNK